VVAVVSNDKSKCQGGEAREEEKRCRRGGVKCEVASRSFDFLKNHAKLRKAWISQANSDLRHVVPLTSMLSVQHSL
jgi:hypothetical protein